MKKAENKNEGDEINMAKEALIRLEKSLEKLIELLEEEESLEENLGQKLEKIFEEYKNIKVDMKNNEEHFFGKNE